MLVYQLKGVLVRDGYPGESVVQQWAQQGQYPPQELSVFLDLHSWQGEDEDYDESEEDVEDRVKHRFLMEQSWKKCEDISDWEGLQQAQGL